MTDTDLLRGLAMRAARALPAEHVEYADGWWLRYASAGSWWVGSVLPHRDAADLAHRIARAEEFYAARGAVPRFQISPGACPDRLDDLLARRGYRRESPMSLRTAPTAWVRAVPAGSPRVLIDDRPTRDWFDVWQAVHGDGHDVGPERSMLERVRQPTACARALIGDRVVAIGRAVADTGWAGLFGMATLPEARGEGAARAVLAALAGWAAEWHAGHLYLQVERDNTAARSLYRRAGFGEVGAYHYRTAGDVSGTPS